MDKKRKELLLFAGTTEGRKLSEQLAAAGICHTLCVATEYGETVLKSSPLVTVRRGRMDCGEIRDFLEKGNFGAVVDATHPYARAVTENIKAAMENMDIPYLRLKRDIVFPDLQGGKVRFFETHEDCAAALQKTEGNILLTTGSRELSWYCASDRLKNRLYVRVLPGAESLTACEEWGIRGRQIIAMQGPFTALMNEAVIRQYGISLLVTKESGSAGGFPEKLAAAAKTGIQVFIIGSPREEAGYSFGEVLRKLEELYGCRIGGESCLEITLAGAGMGGQNSITKEVREAVEEADILLGAARLLEPWQEGKEHHPFYRESQIIPYLKEVQEKYGENKKAVVLFSGDSGFYSGCRKLYQALEKEIREGKLCASVRILPGISSLSALAARLGESYEDTALYSMHGKEVPCLIRKIKRSPKTFLLMSGVKDVNRLGALLIEAGMEACEVCVGYQLSYEEERIEKLSPRECCACQEEGLYVCMVKNPCPQPEGLTPGKKEEEFIREKVPMTKEEIREISICKLHLYPGAVVYDIGSGTGSVSVEIAALSDTIQVYALDLKKEALILTERNKEKYGLENITVTEAKAPEKLSSLPMATHAFIGGSGGNLKEILEELYRINPKMRVVISAVSLETVWELKECLSGCPVRNEEMVQVQVNRVKKMGEHHLMQAENPIWICAFDF